MRLAVLAVPFVASVTVASALTRLLTPASDVAGLVLRAGVVLVAATVTLLLVDRVARRFLPLATLMRLSLVFPDNAPSRFAVARLVNSTRELQRRVDDARAGRMSQEPAEAAKTILALVSAVSRHDRRTRGHSERVRVFTDMLAEEIGLPAGERDRLRWAALVHDTGKLLVPEKLLNKAGRPTEDEWEVLRRHPSEGARLCKPLLPWLGDAGRAIAEHHERYDGKGYPAGLSGTEISLAGRILAVADAFEVMTAARAYKRPMNAAAAREELTRCAGSQFDPGVVRAFMSLSLGRLKLAMGPMSWLAQWPILSHLPQFGQSAGQAGAALSGAAAIGAAGLLSQPTALAPPAMQTAHAQQAAAEHGDTDAARTSGATPEPVRTRARLAPVPVDTGVPEPQPAPVTATPDDPAAPATTTDGGAAPARPGTTSRPTAAQEPPQTVMVDGPVNTADPAPAPATSVPPATTAPAPGPAPTSPPPPPPAEEPSRNDSLTDGLADGVDSIGDTVGGVADAVVEPLPDALGDPVGEVVDDAGDVIDGVGDAIEDTGDLVDGLLGPVGGLGR